ncbi:MAG TPA: DUF3971 domain-containing protein [Microvirga sp.]|jgi:hypothetical protein
MTEVTSPSPRRRRPAQGTVARILWGTLYVKLGLMALVLLGFGLLYLRLSAGPLSFGSLPDRMAESLAARIGPGWTVAMRNTALQLEDGSPALRATGLDIRNPEGALVLRAPLAVVSVDGFSLLSANLQPRSIEFRDLQLRASVNADGSLSFMPGQEAAEVTAPVSATTETPSQTVARAMAGERGGASPISVAVGSILDLIVGPQGVIGSLDRARLTNARLTLLAPDGRERASFRRVDAVFDRTDAGGRRFDATLEGPRGSWQLGGEALAEGTGRYRATMVAADAPVQDILLLSGLSALPATTDLKLSGRIDATYADGKIGEFKANLGSTSGSVQIDDPDTSPLRVEAVTVDAAWNEDRRVVAFRRLELKGGDTHVRLEGELAAPAGEPGWRATLTGRQATLAGLGAGDGPVKIDTIEARVAGQDGIAIESLVLKGPALDVSLTGMLARTADPKGLHLEGRALGTAARTVLRLWPEAVAPPVRRFLVANLKGGLVESLNLKVAMTGEDMARAVGQGPIPDEALRLDFSIANGTLQAADGLPPLSRAQVGGLVTGQKVLIRAPGGQVEMPDGRSLAASEGGFTLDNYWAKDGVAAIGFRLAGGADALGSLLQSPRIREIAAIELDPAAVKGRADLRVSIPLAVHDIPAFADMPLVVTGTVGDLSVEKIFGKERLEGASLAVSYDRGSLAIKGDGKIAGSPATIDVRQARDMPGEAVVAFALDEAARARKGINLGSQLTGPVQLRAAVPLGKAAKPGIRIEADLARAAVDNLVPGWVKPAGRPAKVAFTMVEGQGTEIRDLALDAGPVQLRGSALLSGEGGLEKADLSTFKLSAGDDMRAQIERVNGHYKVVVRGNVGDARPFTKVMNAAPAAPAGRGAASAKTPAKDFDLDLALNILTGHNEEAITNAVIKASLRKDNLRELDMKGRLGSTNVVAQTVPRPGTTPSIVIQAEDAGALLRFVDIYRRMAGGDLVLQLSTGDGPQAGFLTLHSFLLRNEPALRRIIPTNSQIVDAPDASGRTQAVRMDFNEVTFTKARVDFTRSSGRLDFKDAAIWGQAIGFTLGGFIDYARDRADIAGTFVPAYGLNNAFAQVPLFGPLLGGGQYEGLFAVNFRISGQATAPTLSVNPLSAVAPGFLRKLFGTGGGTNATEPQTGSVPPRNSERLNN